VQQWDTRYEFKLKVGGRNKADRWVIFNIFIHFSLFPHLQFELHLQSTHDNIKGCGGGGGKGGVE